MTSVSLASFISMLVFVPFLMRRYGKSKVFIVGLIRDMRNVRGILFMDDLLARYEAYPVEYGSGAEDDAAVILHSSGTTCGVQKPIPFSDRALNDAGAVCRDRWRGWRRKEDNA